MKMICLMKLLCLLNIIICIHGNLVVINGGNARIPCGLGVKLPAWEKGGSVIAFSGDLTINSGTFPRITYDPDNETLILTGAQIADEGEYTCSLSGSSDSTTVSVLAFNEPTWPGNSGGYCSIVSPCQAGASVKWSFIFTSKNNEKKEYKDVETATNATSCPPGKVQLSISFLYKHSDDFGCLEVKFRYDILHNTTGDTSQLSGTSNVSYCVDGCCEIDAVFDYIFFATVLISTLVAAVLGKIHMKILGNKALAVIVLSFVVLVAAVAWFVPLCITVLPVLPEGDRLDQCSCGHPIAFAVLMAIFTCFEGAMIGFVIYSVNQLQSGGGTPTATPAPPDRARGNAGGRQENGRKKETKFKPQDSPENDDTERKRPLPGPPKDEPQMQGKNVLPRIETKKSEREDSVVSRKDVEVHHKDYLRVDDHHHNRTNRGLSATIEPDQLPLNRLTPLDSSKTEKKVKKKKSKGK